MSHEPRTADTLDAVLAADAARAPRRERDGMLTILDKILTFGLTLGFLVFFHELGHFAVAKLFKVPVYEFAFGLPFGKKFLLFKRGGTEYTIRPVVPLGGFVAFADPEAEPEVQLEQMEEYHNKPIWQRFLGDRRRSCGLASSRDSCSTSRRVPWWESPMRTPVRSCDEWKRRNPPVLRDWKSATRFSRWTVNRRR